MTDFSALFVERSRYYLGREYPTKLRRCIEVIPDEAVWHRLAPGANTLGNLLMHLAGNVRQWIVSGVGGAPDARDRPGEFAAEHGPDARTLFATLERTLADADAVLARLTPDDLAGHRTIQSREMTVFEVVYHVVEHFGMHTGQIILMAKLLAPGEISFYEDEPNGLARPKYEARPIGG